MAGQNLTLWAPFTPRAAISGGIVELNGEAVAYQIERSTRRRRTFGVYLTANGDVRIVVPVRATTRSVERTLYKCRHWITKRRLAQKTEPTLPDIRDLREGDAVPYLGVSYRLVVTRDKKLAQACVVDGDKLVVNLPDASLAEDVAEAAQLEILLWYKREAKKILLERTNYWSERLDLRYNRLSVTSPKSRWGSCSPQNDIRLNWRVILRSMDLIDYLIVHELCHVAQKNHSSRFWDLVAAAIPDYKERRKKLRAVM